MKYLIILLLLSNLAMAGKNDIITTIIKIESRGNINAFNKKEDACGILQIRPVMVREVNRISGKSYKLNDRWCWEKSIEMFIIFQNKYNPEWNEEKAARIWNGGQRGMRKKSTDKYYKKYITLKNEKT